MNEDLTWEVRYEAAERESRQKALAKACFYWKKDGQLMRSAEFTQSELEVECERRIVAGGGRAAVDAQAVRSLEVDEQQRHRWVDEQIAEAAEHAVAVVARERELGYAGHANEAGCPALERAVGPPLAVGGSEEEHGAGFDKSAVFVAEVPARQFLVEPVGEAARVEAVLQRSHAGVIRRGCFVVHAKRCLRADRGCCLRGPGTTRPFRSRARLRDRPSCSPAGRNRRT